MPLILQDEIELMLPTLFKLRDFCESEKVNESGRDLAEAAMAFLDVQASEAMSATT